MVRSTVHMLHLRVPLLRGAAMFISLPFFDTGESKNRPWKVAGGRCIEISMRFVYVVLLDLAEPYASPRRAR